MVEITYILALFAAIVLHYILTPKVPKGYLTVDEQIKLKLDNMNTELTTSLQCVQNIEFRDKLECYLSYSKKDRELTYRMLRKVYTIIYGDHK